ncbi:MAG: DUF4102 domain-containing protein [Alphaproteobacteria bacterium]|nr:DUF4102 domain-containing protein [Alphaproteobacteria bacterium]
MTLAERKKPAAATRQRLTTLSVKTLRKHPDRVVHYWDKALPCFGVAVTPNDARSYVVLTRVLRDGGKKTVRKALGSVEDLDLADARERARAWLRLAHEGQDPVAIHEAGQEEKVEASKATFEAMYKIFIARGRKRNGKAKLRERVVEEYKRTLKRVSEGWHLVGEDKPLVPAWGRLPVSQITKARVTALIDAIEKTHPAAAFHAKAVLATFFSWCIRKDVIEHNPCDGVEVVSIESRDRVLSPAELTDLLAGIDAAPQPFADFVRVLLLTAQRRNEVAGMSWSELDSPSNPTTWTLPGARAKNGQPHVVPLSRAAAAIIARQPRIEGSPFVFTATRRRKKTGSLPHLGGFNKPKDKIEKAINQMRAERGDTPMARWVLHDFRRCFVTHVGELEDIRPYVRAQRAEGILAGLARNGVEVTPAIRSMVALQAGDGAIAPHVLDAVLNHKEGVSGARAGVAGTYNRSSYSADARVALQAWADWIESLAKPAATTHDKVVRLHAAG